MANTFTSLHVHVVFSTKNRERWLTADVEEDVWRYPGGICRAHKFTALQIGGVDDHVHLLPGCPATVALSDFIKRLKGESHRRRWDKEIVPPIVYALTESHWSLHRMARPGKVSAP